MIYFYISQVTYIFYSIIKYRYALSNIQKLKYDTKKYRKWIIENKSLFINIDLIGLILIIISLNFNVKVIGVMNVIIYTILFLYNLKTNNVHINKDKKVAWISFIIIIVYLLINMFFVKDYTDRHSENLIFDNTALYYIITVLMGYQTYFITLLSSIITNRIKK